ncbi:hypothetical protein ACLOJK_024611 [Asimina triloba]
MHRNFPEFRTPQHPSLGTNRWGGSSPLLARNIPNESLETSYLKLNSIRTRDEIFPAARDDGNDFMNHVPQPTPSNTFDPPPTPFRRFLKKITKHPLYERRRPSFLSKFSWLKQKREEPKELGGSTQKKRSGWLPDGDYRNRWPQGW